jgi:hypothetical protein
MEKRLAEDRERGVLETPHTALQCRDDDADGIYRQQVASVLGRLNQHRPGRVGRRVDAHGMEQWGA